MSTRDLHSVKQARSVVDQLRRERAVPRANLSVSVDEILRYTQEAQKDDYLLNGFPTDKLNPYRAKNALQCLVL